jgi:hypothetical protein
MTVLRSLSTYSYGGYVASVATTIVPLARIEAGTRDAGSSAPPLEDAALLEDAAPLGDVTADIDAVADGVSDSEPSAECGAEDGPGCPDSDVDSDDADCDAAELGPAFDADGDTADELVDPDPDPPDAVEEHETTDSARAVLNATSPNRPDFLNFTCGAPIRRFAVRRAVWQDRVAFDKAVS